MGTTADSWTIGGALVATGAQTFTGATSCASTLAVTGASTLTGAVSCMSTLYASSDCDFDGALSLAGAATLDSTLAVSGESRMGGVFGVGSAAVLAAIDDNTDSYGWLYCDGTNVKMSSIMLYDHGTSAWRNCYLLNGTLTAV